MMRVEAPGPLRQGAAAFPVAGEGHHVTQKSGWVSVHGVERDGVLRRISEGLELLAEEQSLGQRVMREMIGRRRLNRTPRSCERASEGIGLAVEPVCIILPPQQRQHGPAIGIARRLLNGQFQASPRRSILFCGDPLEESETAQHRLVRAQLVRALAPERFTHGVHQNAVPVGDRGDDPGHEVVLQRENRFRTKSAFIVLGPQMSTGGRIHELYREAQLGPCLAQAAFHHVTRAQFLANCS